MKSIILISAIFLSLVHGKSYAHEYAKGDIQVDHPWARPTPIASVPAAVYFSIKNIGKTSDTLVSIEVAPTIAKTLELHEMVSNGEMMGMRRIEGDISIAAGETVEFVPGGKHIMLRGLSKALAEGEKFPIVLTFKKAGKLDAVVWVEVRD